MEKSPDAFRTISEVAEELDLPQHVLRFWETKFPQIRPLKRGGGRRYYRPDDVELLRGIRHLLYGEGYTIRGVQRILKEEGPRYVQALLREAMGEGAAEDGDARPAPEGRTSALGGFFGLLPGRRGGAAAPERESEPAPRRPARRRDPEDEPNFLDMPLLPDMEPQRAESRHSEPRHVEPRFDPPEDAEDFDPPAGAPEPDGPVFPFRGVGGEPGHPASAPRHAGEPFAAPPFDEDEPPARLTAFRPVQGPEDGLSEEQLAQLRAALVDLQECYRLLLEARRGES
ncbi:MerR family transcriptional regulator [Ancylobacter oerskovii]|uniref:MerR family transcriptional regulator n=1 Tax=Ancylobacter oerskovii TaxID=459519 RepID=UPI003A91780A